MDYRPLIKQSILLFSLVVGFYSFIENDVSIFDMGILFSSGLSSVPFRDITKEPWFKLDFVLPICQFCGVDLNQHELKSKGISIAYGKDPIFDIVPKALATYSLRIEDIVAHLRRMKVLPKDGGFVVNIGAACGMGGYADPTWGLIQGDASIGALLLDGQGEAPLFSAYPLNRTNVNLLPSTKIAVETVVDMFLSQNVPENLTLLKVDIDSWDLGILNALLGARRLGNGEGYKPMLIHMEINTNFPPPLRFTVPLDMTITEAADYQPEIWTHPSLFYGASLASAADVLTSCGYTLLEVDGWDATWIRNEAAWVFKDRLPRSLDHAFYKGFFKFADESPPCFNSNPKIWNTKIHGLAKSVSTAMAVNDQDSIERTMALLRETVTAAAPKHTMRGMPMRYEIDYTGSAKNRISSSKQ